MATNNSEFLYRRMKELREKNGLTMEDMAKRLNKANKSSISRVESGNTSYSALIDLAKEYCETFKMDKVQTEQFLRGDKIVIPDTSALLNNTQLIEELSEEYSKVVVPKIVLDELDSIKNRSATGLSKKALQAKKAWQLLCSVGNNSKALQRDYTGVNPDDNNDCKIIYIAKEVSDEFGCEVDIITNDIDYSAYLKGCENVHAIHLREYRATKQEIVNFSKIEIIDKYYADSYDDCPIPTGEEANAYFNNGYNDGVTLLISTVRNRSVPLEQRKAKIKWLIANDADINKRDCHSYYFPPLSHSAQMGEFEMFIFLLNECHANPNVGSLNPYGANKVRQKNEGNMPLMIVSYHTDWEWRKKPDYEKIAKALCNDSRTSINQQDANGFTALIKACGNGNAKCRDILLAAGADRKIVDLDGKNYEDHWNECVENGPMKERNRNRGKRQW